MSIFNKLFGKKNPLEEIKSAEVYVLSSIYPYFKQFLPSQGEAIDFPDDLCQVDRTKVYNAPFIKYISKHICEDLTCLYAIDRDWGYEIIQERNLEEWDLTEDQLHELALANFRKLLSTNLKGHGDSYAMMLTVNGNLEAGVILIDEIWDQMESQIGEQVVISVPSRDVVIATGKSNREAINTFSEKAKTVLQSGDHPLSKNWFIRNNNHWELFEKIMD